VHSFISGLDLLHGSAYKTNPFEKFQTRYHKKTQSDSVIQPKHFDPQQAHHPCIPQSPMSTQCACTSAVPPLRCHVASKVPQFPHVCLAFLQLEIQYGIHPRQIQTQRARASRLLCKVNHLIGNITFAVTKSDNILCKTTTFVVHICHGPLVANWTVNRSGTTVERCERYRSLELTLRG